MEALRVEAKDAASKHDTALREADRLKQELAGLKGRELASRKMASEHKALASTSTSLEQRVKVLEMHNTSLAQDLQQRSGEMEAAKTAQELAGQERAAAAEREAEYKARLASLQAEVRVSQQHRSRRI